MVLCRECSMGVTDFFSRAQGTIGALFAGGKKRSRVDLIAQGTIEYLVVIGVVVVLSLVVVGLVVSLVDSPSQQISSSGSELGLVSQSIGVTESLVSPVDGNFVVSLLNNSGGFITVSSVRIGESEVNFSEDLGQGGSKFFRVSTGVVCEVGKVVSEDLVVTFVTREGLVKVERYPSKVFFDCTPYSIEQARLANQCPSCEGGSGGCELSGDALASDVLVGKTFYSNDPDNKLTGTLTPMELHTGQTTHEASTVGSDANLDGVAKFYTNNGDGTVTDNHTGLVWQQNHKDNCATLTWASALSYCNTLELGGYNDWRVPSYVELATLPDMSYSSSSYLNSVFTQTGWNSTCFGYWSSSTVPSDPSYAYYLNSLYGGIGADDKGNSSSYGVRCVRSEN